MTTHTTTTHKPTPSKALLFIQNAKGDVRYHKANCPRITGLGACAPDAHVVALATRAMCCKPAVALVAPYREAAQTTAPTVPDEDICLCEIPFTGGCTSCRAAAKAEAAARRTARRTSLVAQVEAAVPALLAGQVVTLEVPAASPAAPAKARPARDGAAARFLVADHPEGYACRCCGQHLPVAKFPTVAGPDVRGTRCRTCRDAKGAA